MSLTFLRPTQFRHCYENHKGSVAVQATKFHSCRDPTPARTRRAGSRSFPSACRKLCSPGPLPPALTSALRRPPRACRHQVSANTFPLPGAPGADTSQPPSLPAGGALSPLGNSSPAAPAGSGALVDAVLRRASPPSGSASALPSSGAPPLTRLRSVRGGGAHIPVSRGGGGCDRQFSLRRSTKRTRQLSPFPFPALNPPPGSPGIVPVEFPLHPAAVFSVLRRVEVTALEEEATAAALASPPPVRCPRSRRGGAAATAAPPLPLPTGRAGSSCDALGLHLIAQRGSRPGIAQVPVLAR